MPCVSLCLGASFVWQHISLLLGADFILFTDGIEKAEPLNSNCISIEKEVLEIEAVIRRTEGSLFFFIRELSSLIRDRTQALLQWKHRGLKLDHQGSPPKGVLMTVNLLGGGGWEKPLEIYQGTPALRTGHCDFIFRDLNGNVDRILSMLLIGWNAINTKASRRNGQNMMTYFGPTGQTQSLLSLTSNPTSTGRHE